MDFAAILARMPLAVRVFVAAIERFMRHDGWALAGYVAYALTVALFPTLIFAASVAAALTSPDDLQALVELLFEFAPEPVARAVEPELRNVLSSRVSSLLTISAAGALWAASSGIEAFRMSFDRAYEVETPRHFLTRRLIGLCVVLFGSIVATVLGLVLVLAPLAFRLINDVFGIEMPHGLGAARYGIGILSLAAFLLIMHLTLPSRRAHARTLWPGILATMTIWTAAATAFSYYLANFNPLTATYGGLTGILVTLLFFYLSGGVIIFGAELNAALEDLRREKEAGDA